MSGKDYCYVQALGNMNENDWPGSCCYIDCYMCSVLFLSCFFPERAAHSKSAMIVVFFAVNTLPTTGSAFMVCMFWRDT